MAVYDLRPFVRILPAPAMHSIPMSATMPVGVRIGTSDGGLCGGGHILTLTLSVS